MTTGLARTLARSVVAPYVGVFVFVLASYALGVHLAVDVLGDRADRARLDTLARAAVSVVERTGRPYEVGDQANGIANPVDQRATWYDLRGRVVAVRGADAAALRGRVLEVRTVPVGDGRGGATIGTVRLVQSDERRERTLFLVDIGLGFGFVLATLAAVAGGRILSYKSIERLTENVRSLEEFSANAAHELRTPLAAIIANGEASLRAGALEKHDAHRVETVVATAMSMRRLSDDLLTLAIPGRVNPAETHRIDLEEVVTSALALVAPLAERGGVRTLAQIDGAPWVVGRPDQIERIVVNLIENAVRYTAAGGRVVVAARDDRGEATIVVRDTGIGIAPADRRHIFERFWRADHARRVGDGSGLGLAIVAALVERHGGSIRVESELGVGSTFTVRLPHRA
ncbi:MAG: hypothetical protein NVSMB19_22940 [Vulcanimicrobiaceae bacterium]